MVCLADVGGLRAKEGLHDPTWRVGHVPRWQRDLEVGSSSWSFSFGRFAHLIPCAHRDALDGRVVLYFYPPKEMPKRELGLRLSEDGAEEAPRSAGHDGGVQERQEDAAEPGSEGESEDEQEGEEEDHDSSDEDEEEELPSRTSNAFALLEEECP